MDKYMSVFKCLFLTIYLDLSLMITGVLGTVMAQLLVWMVIVDVQSWPLQWNCSVAQGKYLETGIAMYSGVWWGRNWWWTSGINKVWFSFVDALCLLILSEVHNGIEGGDPQKISWQKLLKFVCKNHLIITNWPLGVPPPGPSFDFKKLKAGSLHRLVVPYLYGQSDEEVAEDALGDLPEIEVKLWHEGLFY